MTGNKSTCPIWDTPAVEIPSQSDGKCLDSPRAGGRYFIAGSAEEMLAPLDNRGKVRLTNWLVEQRSLGCTSPRILAHRIGNVQALRDPDVSHRVDRVLRYLASRSRELGSRIEYRLRDTSSLYRQPDKTFLELLAHSGCIKVGDLMFLMKYLKRCGLVDIVGVNNSEQHCAVTVEGYERLAELSAVRTDSSRAFVAMWFDRSMDQCWEEGFAPAIRQAGYNPVRIDHQEHLGKIDDMIISEIRRTRFIVADFTHGDEGARGGVYYEAGFAYGLGIPVIYTCRRDSFDTIHFDTRQYNHVVWENHKQLIKDLTSRITATIGQGPDKPASQQ